MFKEQWKSSSESGNGGLHTKHVSNQQQQTKLSYHPSPVSTFGKTSTRSCQPASPLRPWLCTHATNVQVLHQPTTEVWSLRKQVYNLPSCRESTFSHTSTEIRQAKPFVPCRRCAGRHNWDAITLHRQVKVSFELCLCMQDRTLA